MCAIEEDEYIVDCIFKSKQKAEEYAKHHNEVNNSFGIKVEMKIKEMGFSDDDE